MNIESICDVSIDISAVWYALQNPVAGWFFGRKLSEIFAYSFWNFARAFAMKLLLHLCGSLVSYGKSYGKSSSVDRSYMAKEIQQPQV